MPEEEIGEALEPLGLQLVAFDGAQAYRAGFLQPHPSPAGLSLGDRACLALAQHLGLPVLTTERVWADLPLEIPVLVIR